MRKFAATITTTACALVAACGGHDKTATVSNGNVATPATTGYAAPAVVDTAPAAHHSKLKGALVGAAAGHVLGGHAALGAAAGALVQHERNKH